MATTESNPSRRVILGAILSAPALAATANPVPAAATVGGASPAFARKVAAWRAAETAEAAFDEGTYFPALDAYDRASEAVPHVSAGTHPYTGRSDVSTADAYEVTAARRLVGDVDAGRCFLEVDRYPSLGDHLAFCRRLAAAADERDAALDRLGVRYRVAEHEATSARLAEVTGAAFAAVRDHRAASAADLAAKLEILDEAGAHESSEAWTAILADARRLAGGEA